jgi:hypothetical protein
MSSGNSHYYMEFLKYESVPKHEQNEILKELFGK